MIGMRLPPDLSTELHHVQNVLYFDDGGMRGLACALVWCGLIHHAMTFKDEDLAHPSMVELARNLLSLPTFHRAQTDEATAMIKRIIKQNSDAKKLPVSSYEWSVILKNLCADKTKALTVQEAMDMYNSNPEVCAHGGSGKDTRIVNGHGASWDVIELEVSVSRCQHMRNNCCRKTFNNIT